VWAPDKVPVPDLLKKARQDSEVTATTVSATYFCHRGSIRHPMKVDALRGELRSHRPSIADPCRELWLQSPLGLNECFV
jgi:hypothetical protein